MTGIGAKRTVWNAHHKPDPDPRLSDGCCFLPKVTASGETRDTWVVVMYERTKEDRVFSYTRNFADGIDETTALLALTREDLPADAVLVSTRQLGTCKSLLYSSPSIVNAFGGNTTGVLLTLYSDSTAGPYRSSQVEEAILFTSFPSSEDSEC